MSSSEAAIDLSVELCGVELEHPIINGSGTFDAVAARRAFGDAVDALLPFSMFVSKTITPAPRAGNRPARLYETPAGMVNSIGLPNKGLEGFIEGDLPELVRSRPCASDITGRDLDLHLCLEERCATEFRVGRPLL